MSGNNNNRSSGKGRSSYTYRSGSQPRTVKKTQGGMRTRSLQEKQASSKPTLDEVVQQEENALEASLAKAVQEHDAYTDNIEDTVFMKESDLRKMGFDLDRTEQETGKSKSEEEQDAGLTQAVSREELRKAAEGSKKPQKNPPERAEAEKRPQNNGKKKKKQKQKEVLTPKQKMIHTIIGIVIFLIVAGICAIGYLTAYKIFYDVPLDPNSTEMVEVTVTETMTPEQVYDLLTEKGLIAEGSFVFKVRAKLFDLEPVAGKYKLTAAYNTEKIINIISGYDYSDGTMEDD